MFVVKRPFRDAEGMVPAGSIVEPAGLKRFEHRLREGHIVEVTEQNFNEYAYFFKKRFGVNLPKIEPKAEEPKAEEPKAEEKPVTKVVVK